MKEINKTTLEAIQSNVKTKETQELDYSRENLFKGTWKDFEIADLQPNLIPNGWDSFKPYGSGKNYLPSPEEYIFSESRSGANITFEYGVPFDEAKTNNAINIVSTGSTIKKQIRIRYFSSNTREEFTERITIRNNSGGSIVLWTGIMGENVIEPHKTLDIENTKINPYNDMFNGYIENVEDVSDIDVTFFRHEIFTPNDNPLTVEKTPLENGLTHIQTWGGNHEMKLLCVNYNTQEVNKNYTYGLYVEKLNEKLFVQYDQGKFMIEGYNKETVIATSTTLNFQLRAARQQDNLDFIASEPQVVEGDKHNPVMVVDTLEDGREHVQVYGAYPDTKLVYKGGEGFIGEEYVLKTNIENKGIGLNIKTPLSDDLTYIGKGENQVNIQGELKEKLSIEVGIPNE